MGWPIGSIALRRDNKCNEGCINEHLHRVSWARGIGELGEVSVAAAITNAIYHTTGKRIRKLPVHIADLVV
jgi:CO/xanthine dehydrogenase Mo-binding subunit